MKISLPIKNCDELLKFLFDFINLSTKDQQEVIMVLYNECREENSDGEKY